MQMHEPQYGNVFVHMLVVVCHCSGELDKFLAFLKKDHLNSGYSISVLWHGVLGLALLSCTSRGGGSHLAFIPVYVHVVLVLNQQSRLIGASKNCPYCMNGCV